MQYIRRPTRFDEEKTTTLVDGVLTGENGAAIQIADIKSIKTYRLTGVLFLVVQDSDRKVTIRSDNCRDGEFVQENEIVNSFLTCIKAHAKHDIEYIEGSNLVFYGGVVLLVTSMALACMMLVKGSLGDRPGRAMGTLIALFVVSGVLMKGGRAKKSVLVAKPVKS